MLVNIDTGEIVHETFKTFKSQKESEDFCHIYLQRCYCGLYIGVNLSFRFNLSIFDVHDYKELDIF